MRWRVLELVSLIFSATVLASCASSAAPQGVARSHGIESPEYISTGTERVVALQWKLFPDGSIKGMVHAVAKIGSGKPIDLGRQPFVGTRRKIVITFESPGSTGGAGVLDGSVSLLAPRPIEFVSRVRLAFERSEGAVGEIASSGGSAGLVQGFLSQGDVALTVIFPVTVGCPDTPMAQSVIFVEGTSSEFNTDVGKMTGVSGCPDAPPT